LKKIGGEDKENNNTPKRKYNKKNTNKKKKSNSILETNKPARHEYRNRIRTKTNTGHNLTPLEAKFIQLYVETGNGMQSVIQAGYKCKSPRQYAQELLTKPYIAEEITYQLEQFKKNSIATAEEVMEFYTKVMRGEVKDQFELDAPLSERIKAGNELAKRLVDIPNKLEGKSQATVTISLDWSGMEENDNDGENAECGNDGEKC